MGVSQIWPKSFIHELCASWAMGQDVRYDVVSFIIPMIL